MTPYRICKHTRQIIVIDNIYTQNVDYPHFYYNQVEIGADTNIVYHTT